MKTLNIGEIVTLEGRIYRIEWSKFDNGKMQGNRAIFKLLREKELYELINKLQEEQHGKNKDNTEGTGN